MKRSDRPFVVGRRTRHGTTVVLLHRSRAGAPKAVERMRGPWTLRAVVTPDPAR